MQHRIPLTSQDPPKANDVLPLRLGDLAFLAAILEALQPEYRVVEAVKNNKQTAVAGPCG